MSDSRVDAIVEAVVRALENQQLNSSTGVAPAFGSPVTAGGVKTGHLSRRATNLKVSILGAGHGGLAMAGHLALFGFNITLFSFFDRELEPVIAKGGIEIVGDEVSGLGKVNVTKSIDQAVKGAELIMICAPAVTHTVYATLLAGLLQDGQVVVLNPGRTGGALEFANLLRRFALNKRIYLAEAQTFIYASELRGPGKVEVLHEKFKMRAAAIPATDNQYVIQVLNQIYPQIEAGKNVLETSINNIGPVVHPAPMLLNTSVMERVAKGEDLRYYKQQVTPTISNMVMEKVDCEKAAIGHLLGLDVWRATDWYRESYHVQGNNLYEILQNNKYYQGFHAGGHLMAYNHILDEVPDSLVPLSVLGKQLGVPTPTIDVLVDLANVMTGIDFWGNGRTAQRMGIQGMNAAQLLDYVENQSYLGRCAVDGACRSLPWFA